MKQANKEGNPRHVAVIDIGSNTFHLLIVSYQSDKETFKELHRERKFVYLAKDGITHLSQQTISRGLTAMKELSAQCVQYGIKPHDIKAIGTAALRSADNAQEFISKVSIECGIDIEVITGRDEAELIYKGISHSNTKMIDDGLIIDIGGGSVEFIISNEEGMGYYASYNIGISQLRHQFGQEDPLSIARMDLIYQHLDEVLSKMLNQTENLNIKSLIGASGPFEIIEAMCEIDVATHDSVSTIKVDRLIDDVIYLPLVQRMQLPLMPKSRADLSVESLLLIRYLLDRIRSIDYICISPYALKEGVIFDMI